MRLEAMTPPARTYTPPLGHKVLTPLYDLAIGLLTREGRWRKALIENIAPNDGERIVDVGSGTGSLAVALLSRAPHLQYLGVDPDAEAAVRAKKKVAAKDLRAEFKVGFFEADKIAARPDKIVSSLVLHQVPFAEKRRIIENIYAALPANGTVHIADYGEQTSVLGRALFRMTVQQLDGVDNTQPNAEGVIPELLSAAGFSDVSERSRIWTLTGTISIYQARKRTPSP